jgi:dynein heavy chain, axonemal
VQADLDKALPALEEAVSSLKSLSKNDVVEVKSLSNPPAGVKMVMDACCIMFDLRGKKVADPNGGPGAPKTTDYWDDAKRILNDPSKFLNSLMTYDKDNIAPV